MSMFLFILLLLMLTASLVLIVYGFSAPLAQAALVFLYILVDGHYIGWKMFVAVLIAAIAAELIEFFAGARGVKKAEGSRRSAWGSIIGGFAGSIVFSPVFFPIGSILGIFGGTFVGALVMEYTASKTSSKALTVSYRALIGRVWGFFIKTGISLGIIFMVTAGAFF
ncbi:MAG: DUF456 domain-containing protein [Fibrobacteria bacterium]|nr:DUF456 domain-containing protein [Fibrobacteria bacterium]